MAGKPEITAWRPPVDGVREVFHAHFPDHAYPSHTHDTWTLLVVDQGIIRYGLDRSDHGALRSEITLLPPHVPHDGRAAKPGGFRKRVIYLEQHVIGEDLIGAAVDQPAFIDPVLRRRIDQLHVVLAEVHEEFEAQSRLTLVQDRLRQHLRGRIQPVQAKDPGLARRLRDVLDEHTAEGLSLAEAARLLQAHPAHLVRAFSNEFGLPPHRYLTGRRVDVARRLLLDGMPAAEVAVAAGFYDQAHLTRHFRRMLGIGPAAYARGSSGPVLPRRRGSRR